MPEDPLLVPPLPVLCEPSVPFVVPVTPLACDTSFCPLVIVVFRERVQSAGGGELKGSCSGGAEGCKYVCDVVGVCSWES